MIDEQKKLSVIVPCYNVEGYVERCIESLVHQDIDSNAYEVLLIDDGSTDGTGAICDRYATQYPQIKVIHQPNAGQGAARNTGLDHATGEYIFFVDSDDFIAENCLKQLVNIAKANSLDVLTFNIQQVVDDKTVSALPMTNKPLNEVNVVSGIDYLQTNGWLANVWWYIAKRSFIEDRHLRFPVGHMLEDISFTLELLLSANRIAKDDAVCYYYVQRPQSIMHNNAREHQRKFVSDCLYCYHLTDDVIAKYRNAMPDRLYLRLSTRRDVHLYIGLQKAFKLGEVKVFYKKLKAEGLLPLNKIDQSEFSGLQWDIARFIFNRPAFTCILSKLYNVFTH